MPLLIIMRTHITERGMPPHPVMERFDVFKDAIASVLEALVAFRIDQFYFGLTHITSALSCGAPIAMSALEDVVMRDFALRGNRSGCSIVSTPRSTSRSGQ